MNVARKRDGQGRSSTALGAAYLTASFTLGAGAAIADPIPLPDYLASIDRTEISFSGRIRYDSSKDSFTFYDDNRNPFGMSLDAGRDARERIESECDNTSFMVSYSDLCTIVGSGTVEIRGSRIFISIETVNQLGN